MEAIFHVVLYSSFHKSTLCKTPSGGFINTSRCEECVDRENCEAVHQSLTWTRVKGLWCYNSLSFNLIFYVFFSSSFVCLFPWFWLLSFLRRYVHLLFPNASPSLSSQVLLVVCHAFVLFLIFFFITLIQGFFVCRLFLHFVSPLTHLTFRCLSVTSLTELADCPRSFIFVGRLLGAFATPWAWLGELMLCDRSAQQFDPFFSVCCGGHSLWSVFLKLHYTPSCTVSTTKEVCLSFKINHVPLYPVGNCCLLSGFMEREYCTFLSM